MHHLRRLILPLILLFPSIQAWAGEFARPLRTWQPLDGADVDGVLTADRTSSITIRTSDGRALTLENAKR